MKLKLLLLSLVLFCFTSCQEEEDQPCSSIIICSEELVTITVTIQDDAGKPVILDEFYTFIDSRTRIDVDRSTTQIQNGIYPVATDSNSDLIDFDGTNVVFVGKIGSVNVIENAMVIGKDCCHIELLQGETQIVLN